MKEIVKKIGIASMFFVFGQLCLKTDKNNALQSSLMFSLTMGLGAVLYLVYDFINPKNSLNVLTENIDKTIIYSVIAGLLFFIGNIFWVQSIQLIDNISLVRVLLAGFETLLLVAMGYLLFNSLLKLNQFIGICLVLIGIYFISID